jgi:hypothetical protein
MLFQDLVMFVLLVFVNNGISIMLMRIGKKELWNLFKNNLNVTQIFYIMI